MPLLALSVGVNDGKVPYVRQKMFGYEAWHVLEVFMSVLRDELQFDLDGVQNLMILLAGQGDQPRYQKQKFGRNVQAMYFFDGFDVRGYFDSDAEKRPDQIADLVEQALTQLAKQLRVPAEPVAAAARAARNRGTSTTLPTPKTYPWDKRRPEAISKSGRFRGTLIRTVAPGSQIWSVEVRDHSSGQLLTTATIPERVYRYSAAGNVFHRAECEGEVFRLRDLKGKTTFRLDLKQAAKAAAPVSAAAASATDSSKVEKVGLLSAAKQSNSRTKSATPKQTSDQPRAKAKSPTKKKPAAKRVKAKKSQK